MAMRNLSFHLVDPIQLEASHSEAIVRKDCNSFLKTKQGFHYLMMKYPNLSVSQAIDEYIKEKAIRDSLTAYVDYVVQRSY
jgi:hypothetical protein